MPFEVLVQALLWAVGWVERQVSPWVIGRGVFPELKWVQRPQDCSLTFSKVTVRVIAIMVTLTAFSISLLGLPEGCHQYQDLCKENWAICSWGEFCEVPDPF